MINMGLNHLIHPDWVESIFEKMPPELRERIVKTAIYALVKPDDSGFKIHSFLGENSNRAPSQQTEDDIITAFAVTEAWIAYTSTENPADVKYAEHLRANDQTRAI